MSDRPDVWIQGAGELASAVAVALVGAGCRVVLAEIERPLAVRRLACFAEAVYAGTATVAGVPGRLVAADGVAFAAPDVAVVVDPLARALARLRPGAVVDARLTKRAPAPLPRGDAPLVGLGPGFTCGLDADLVIETHRDAGCGRVIASGGAAADTGVPGPVAGQTSLRLLRSPAAGRLRASCMIGDLVSAGQVVGEVGGLPVTSRLDGLLRGLIHEQVDLVPGLKIGDVDPRGAAVDPRAVTDKGRAVGAGVVAALARLGLLEAPSARGG
jgi:xanthine dehydrogenase accessory factor